MTDSLFQQLKNIGIDGELAHQVSASLDPDHNASKKDMLVLQEAILQIQARTDERYYELKADLTQSISDLRIDLSREINHLTRDITDTRIEIHTRNRHAIYAFGGLFVSVFAALAINVYFHLKPVHLPTVPPQAVEQHPSPPPPAPHSPKAS
ncbi:hypothetical protein [Endozoicomonas sp. ONNA2]|uniref:hypothetical protein n=1 Tax=Endozoicomonas sp. ONNA2 TaxID=2828741 RepID=UPI002147EDAB|nr:hypothetical protein [Endozoicomonas sp. ONNA2]